MTLARLLEIVDGVYPDGLVGQYVADMGGNHGDTLAKFIAQEIIDTFNGEADEIQQLIDARDAIDKAMDELNAVWNELHDRVIVLKAVRAQKAEEPHDA